MGFWVTDSEVKKYIPVQANGFLSCGSESWHVQALSATVPLLVDNIVVNEVEFCANTEETLC